MNIQMYFTLTSLKKCLGVQQGQLCRTVLSFRRDFRATGTEITYIHSAEKKIMIDAD